MYKIDEGVNEKEVIGKYTVKQLEEIFKEYVGDKDALDEESLQLLTFWFKIKFPIRKQILFIS